MPVVFTPRLTRSWRWSLTAAVAIASTATISGADTIVVDGEVYENVYIGEGASSYYIQIPSNGTMITVPKSAVTERDIQITPDRNERRRLRDQWRAKRLNSIEGTPATTSYEEWRSNITESLPERKTPDAIVEKSEAAPVTATLPPPAASVKSVPTAPAKIVSPSSPGPESVKPVRLSNIRDLGAKFSGQKLFMDQHGVAVITNRPEQFEGRPEYVELTIHYDPIEVPKQFRRPKAQPQQRGVLGGNTIDDMIAYYAKYHALEPSLVYAVIKVESNGNQFAVSKAGARGLMQLMPGTAREMGVKDIFDPAENIAGGTQYLSKMFGMFNEDVELALAGYNAGPGNVKKYGGIPPFKETQNYVRLVRKYQAQYKRSGTPRFDVATSPPVDPGYLPPESSEYYQILLDNGLTVAAEEIYPESDRYVYFFKGRSGHFPITSVISVREPTAS